MIKSLLALVAIFTVALPVAAQAQVPSYGQGGGDESVHGRVASFDGAYGLRVRDERGYIDNVELHPGTIINPTGITLAPGMVVNILGYNSGSYLAANEIDTPYTYYGGVPYYAGHPWNYYGPSISLGFFFGNGGWWRGGPGFRTTYWNGGARIYPNGAFHSAYHPGGAFYGRDYVAPRGAGGYYHGNPNGFVHGSSFAHNGGFAHGGGGGYHGAGAGAGGAYHGGGAGGGGYHGGGGHEH